MFRAEHGLTVWDVGRCVEHEEARAGEGHAEAVAVTVTLRLQ